MESPSASFDDYSNIWEIANEEYSKLKEQERQEKQKEKCIEKDECDHK